MSELQTMFEADLMRLRIFDSFTPGSFMHEMVVVTSRIPVMP